MIAPAPTHKPLMDYFENLNAQLVHFPEKSFFRMDLEEIMGSIRSGVNFPAMSVESPEGDTEGSSATNSLASRMGAFTIWMNPKSGDFDQQNDMLDLCERIGLKIVARMRSDARIPGKLLYNRFDVGSVKFMKVGPWFTEELYGYRFTFSIAGNESLKIDPKDWQDVNGDCPSFQFGGGV